MAVYAFAKRSFTLNKVNVMSVVYLKFSRVFFKGNICGGEGAGKEKKGRSRAAPVGGVWPSSRCKQSWVNQRKNAHKAHELKTSF